MSKHLIIMTLVMEDMDGTPNQSAEILLDRNHHPHQDAYPVLTRYLDDNEVEVTAEEYRE